MSFVETWIDSEAVIQSEISQKEKNKYIHAYMRNLENGVDSPIHKAERETGMYRVNRWTIQGEGGWDELGHWDRHTYIVGFMCNTDN